MAITQNTPTEADIDLFVSEPIILTQLSVQTIIMKQVSHK